MNETKTLDKATILFAGDSGDGIQMTGFEFSNTAAIHGNDIRTFPDYPAEIRAPIGTLSGVSGFKLNFGSDEVYTSGGLIDVLVVMNAAALKMNISQLKPNGLIIANSSGFDQKNLRLAEYLDKDDPLETAASRHKVIQVEVTKLTREALKDSTLSVKERDRSKNMFVLGFIYWLYHRDTKHTEEFLNSKFSKKQNIAKANIQALKAGYNYGVTTEASFERYDIKPAKLTPGTYRNIIGNQGLALGLTAASVTSGLQLFFGSYPITPASDILHELAKHKHFGVKSFQAEDEIAAIGSAIGASFAGSLSATASSGPGIALKGEAMGLAVMLELPLVVINVQRGGPSTGLPTKTEQSDLLQALYGRNGEAPLPVLAVKQPADAFETAYLACKIAIEHMTPVMVLSDGYIANGAEPWKFPTENDLEKIVVPKVDRNSTDSFQPYLRDEKGVRKWATIGEKGLEHRVGGLEKEDVSGNVSYDPENHERMVRIRANKVERVADFIPKQMFEFGDINDDILVLGWGSTFGSIKSAVSDLRSKGIRVAQVHVRHLLPFPTNLKEIIGAFDKVLIPELNDGQLIKVIRDKFLVDAKGLHKIKGQPFLSQEIEDEVMNMLEKKKF